MAKDGQLRAQELLPLPGSPRHYSDSHYRLHRVAAIAQKRVVEYVEFYIKTITGRFESVCKKRMHKNVSSVSWTQNSSQH